MKYIDFDGRAVPFNGFHAAISHALLDISTKERSLKPYRLEETDLPSPHLVAAVIMPTPMKGDQWIQASALQKAIRRGEHERASAAAYGLWLANRERLWKRLYIIALEDVGIGNAYAVIETLRATANARWRKAVGDDQVAIYLTQLLCDSIKSRTGDELYIIAAHEPSYTGQRQRFPKAANEALKSFVMDHTQPIAIRALALWNLAGTKKFPCDTMEKRLGSIPALVETLRELSNHSALSEACVGVMNRTPYPLSIFMPLITESFGMENHNTVEVDDIEASPDVQGIPLYALDMFTRVGLASIRKLQKKVKPLQSYTAKQVGLALFYIEGGRVNQRLTSPGLNDLRQSGETCDLDSAGLAVPDYLHLKDGLRKALPTLTSIRHDLLTEYMAWMD